MAKGILISFAGYPYTLTSFMPDNGLANLAGALINNGHEVKIVDYGTVDLIRKLVPEKYTEELKRVYIDLASPGKRRWALRRLGVLESFLEKERKKSDFKVAHELVNLIKKDKPNFLGLKLWLGDSFNSSIKIATLIKKEFPRLKVYAGGPLIDIVKELFYKKTQIFDALVYGEGEESIIDLAVHSIGKRSLNAIPNLIYLDGAKVVKNLTKRIGDLNSLPFPVYDDNVYGSLNNNQKIKILVLDESRGCPNQCAFCPHRDKSGNFWRRKSSSRIIAEINRFILKYNTNVFRYAGSNPPFDLLAEVAEGILKKNLKVKYTSFTHVNTIKLNKLSILKKSGLFAFSFGIESGDDRILKEIMLKNISFDLLKKVLIRTINEGIFTVGSIIFPAPTENKKSRENTLDLLLSVFKGRKNVSVQIYFPGLYPTSTWGKTPEKYDFQLEGDVGNYALRYMDYKIKRLFPPSFWKPLPYKISNKSHKEFSSETESMLMDLEKNAILTNVADEDALIAHTYDPKLSQRNFRDRVREFLFTSNYNQIADIVYRINKNIQNNL